ncbi:MAG: PEGA domain-containing protein [Kiritimatiellae bacterium]|jgi:hypothetical protein|nr:PEGA domain-containing protein [Kiritimatiellia bacterium]
MKIGVVLLAVFLPLSAVFAVTDNVSASIFVKSLLDEKYNDKADVLNSLLVSRMSSEGFNIVDKNDVVVAINDLKKDKKASKDDKELLEQVIKFDKQIRGNASEEYDILDDTSILRLSQMLNCDYFIVSTLTSYNQNKKSFKGYGVEKDVIENVLRVSIKLADAVNDGGSVYGDTVIVKKSYSQSENLQQDLGDMMDSMIDEASVKITENILAELKKMKKPLPKTDNVEFSVVSDIPGAVIELDGAVLGSTPGKFKVKPGIHQIRVTKPRYVTWERKINVFPQQILNVAMVKSDQGIDADRKEVDLALDEKERISDIESKEKMVDTAAYAGKKDADSREKIAEGQKERDSSSYEKIEGAPPDTIYIDRDRDGKAVINNNVIEK